MTTNHLYNCLSCGRQYNPNVLQKCPVCQTAHLDTGSPQSSSTTASPSTGHSAKPAAVSTLNSRQDKLWSSEKRDYALAASFSAATVDSYGRTIQIVGYVIALLTFLGFTFVWGPGNDLELLGFIIGLIAAGLTIWAYQVLGALYRMIANYILFRITD